MFERKGVLSVSETVLVNTTFLLSNFLEVQLKKTIKIADTKRLNLIDFEKLLFN